MSPKKATHFLALITALLFNLCTSAQRFSADYDSTLFIKDTVRPLIGRFQNLHFSGYMQPQFQVAQKEGISSFEGGSFAEHSNNRFMLRRARIKVDYLLEAKEKLMPKALFTFQIDATERGLLIQDMFLRLYEPRKQNFSLTMGMVTIPFGYEVNLSSAYREAPEQGRMSQILTPTEKDLGAMFTYETIAKKKAQFRFDVGFFNGQGLFGVTDFDSYKDVISRLTLKPLAVSKNVIVSGGLSFLNGGWLEESRYRYKIQSVGNDKFFIADSSRSNINSKAPRRYYGADLQLVVKHQWGKTEGRAEYWRGQQSGTSFTTVTPSFLPIGPTYVRNFDGAFFYFLQNIINQKWELMLKYDWYDPNTKVQGLEIGKAGTNLTAADIKYNTLGIGLTRYFTGDLKLLAYYSFVKNERTALAGFENDLPDNVFTFRMQLRF